MLAGNTVSRYVGDTIETLAVVCLVFVDAVVRRVTAVLPLWAMTYVALSVVSFVLYGLDKKLAENHIYRIPERTLLIVDAAGGWPGGWLAMKQFRHKTRKASYLRRYRIVTLMNVVGWLAFFYYFCVPDNPIAKLWSAEEGRGEL